VLQKAELSGEADSENYLGGSSETIYYIGLDVHKLTISYCVKDAAGRIHQEGKIGSTRRELDAWIKTLPQPRMIAMEATIFTGWIYDHLLPHAEKVKVAHPLMLRAIAAAKRKNDKIDACKIADCLRAISCRSAIWHRPRSATGGARCAIADCWSSRWCR
jgi:transposase